MVTVGSVTREEAAGRFPFLAARYPGRRAAIREFTHRDPEYVFWVWPDGRLADARGSHRRNPPRGHEYILDDEPDYGGFLRGRVASLLDDQLIVVYYRPEALAAPGATLTQLLAGDRRLRPPSGGSAHLRGIRHVDRRMPQMTTSSGWATVPA
jgi:hypothetical protein